MPYNFSYNPGVQDVSGQLLGQGISQAGQGIAKGVDQYQRQQEENKKLAAQAKALEQLLPTYGQAAGIDPAEIDKLLAPSADESVRSRAVRLSTTMEGMIETAKAKQQASENQARAAQAQLAQQESARMQQQMAQQQRNQAAMSAALNGGITAPDIDKVIQDLPAGNRFQGLPTFQPNAADIDQLLGRYTQAGGQIDPSVAELFTRMDATQARREARGVDGNDVVQKYTAEGVPYLLSKSRGVFQFAPESSDQKVRGYIAEQEAKSKIDESSKLLSEVSDSAEIARQKVATIDRISALYSEGAKTGFGQPVLNQASAILQRAGYAQDGLANQQQLDKELNNMVLTTGRELMKGAGSVSNYERQLIGNASANSNLTPQANLQILNVIKRIGERSVMLDQKRSELEEAGKSRVEIANELRRLRDAMPVGADVLAPLSVTGAAGGANGPARIRRYDPKTGTLK